MEWRPDVLDGFEQATLTMADAADGPVEVVLTRRRLPDARGGVLYVHGFVDYFFQVHLADFYADQGLHFYAVDLRRHGRSLRPHQRPNFTRDVDEYVADVDAALDVLTGADAVDWVLLNGHSTGGLVAALVAHRGVHRGRVDAVFLNSPFLDMNLPTWQERFVEPLVAAVGRVAPGLRLPGVPSFYGESLHVSRRGTWEFDQAWKPVDGFPARAGWFRAIHRAHAEVDDGLAIRCPVLVLHAERSLRPTAWSDDVRTADVVLDVDDMRRLAPRLGADVEVRAVPGAVHDVVLSDPDARRQAFAVLAEWLGRVRTDPR